MNHLLFEHVLLEVIGIYLLEKENNRIIILYMFVLHS